MQILSKYDKLACKSNGVLPRYVESSFTFNSTDVIPAVGIGTLAGYTAAGLGIIEGIYTFGHYFSGQWEIRFGLTCHQYQKINIYINLSGQYY